MRKVIGLFVALAIMVSACDNGAREQDERLANSQLEIYQKSQPVPTFDYSQVRDTLIQIQSLLVEGRQGYATIVSPITGAPLFSCPAIGFPIPADTQITNPLQVVFQGAVVEQMEPIGTFTSKNTNATYILCVIEGGKAIPVYSEPPVIASGAPLVWDGTQYHLEGEPSMVIEVDK